MVKEKEQTVVEMEKKQEQDEHTLEHLSKEATAVWDELQSAMSLQSQSQHHAQQLLDLIQEGHKLLKPAKEILRYVCKNKYVSVVLVLLVRCHFRFQSSVELKKKEVEKQTQEILVGQNKLGLQRRSVRDLQAQLLEIQGSKKTAVTGTYVHTHYPGCHGYC